MHDRIPEINSEAFKEAERRAVVLSNLKSISFRPGLEDVMRSEKVLDRNVGKKAARKLMFDLKVNKFFAIGISGSGKTTVLDDLERYALAAGIVFKRVGFGKYFREEEEKDPGKPMTQDRRIRAMTNMKNEVEEILKENPNAKIGIETLVLPSKDKERGGLLLDAWKNDGSMYVFGFVHTQDITESAILSREIAKRSETSEQFLVTMAAAGEELFLPDLAKRPGGWEKLRKLILEKTARPEEIRLIHEEEKKAINDIEKNPLLMKIFADYYKDINFIREFTDGTFKPNEVEEVAKRAALTRLFLEYHLRLDALQFDIVINTKVKKPHMLGIPTYMLEEGL